MAIRVRPHRRRGTKGVVGHDRSGTTRDSRSIIIKNALATAFPNYQFRVRVEKYSGGESINIKTNYLLPFLPHSDAVWRVGANANPSSADYDEYNKYRRRIEENKKREEEVYEVIKSLKNTAILEDIHYDEFSGDVLQGANRYVFIRPLNQG